MLEELGLADLVDAVVLSCEIGCAKPSSAIYRSALDRLGVEAARAVFVDDQAAYCSAAAALGMRSVHISLGALGHSTQATQSLSAPCWS